MRKYLLLASVAGCLMSANALATDLSETMNVTGSIGVARSLEVTQNFDFGTVVLTGRPDGETALLSCTSGHCLCDADICQSVENSHTGHISATNVDLESAYSSDTLTISDADLGGGLYFREGSHSCNGSCATERDINGNIYADQNVTEGLHEGTVTVTLSY